jgi:hypothetical protein
LKPVLDSLIRGVAPAKATVVGLRQQLFDDLVQSIQVDIGQDWAGHSSYKVANMLIEFSTSIPRTQLRPGYGDGFLGAPLLVVPPQGSPTPREQGDRRGTSRTHKQHGLGDSHHV